MNERELEKIYNEAYRAVYWMAMSFLKNEADAEDVVQDAFVTMIESYDTIEDKSKLLAWLKKTTANKCLNRLTRNKTDAVGNEFFDDVEAVPEDFLPDAIIESAEMRKVIMGIIEKSVSEDIQRTLILFYFDEMSTREISEALGVPEGTVRSRLNFARTKIKKEVLKYEKESNTKLLGMAALPFLSKLFIKEAEQVVFKPMPASLTSALSASAKLSAREAEIKLAAKAAKKGTRVMTKNIIAICAGIAAVGVITGGILFFSDRNENSGPENMISETVGKNAGRTEASNAAQGEQDETEIHGNESDDFEFKISEIGQIIEFGHYEQDNDVSNGMEPIEWEVLAAWNDRALLISKYVLDAGTYDKSSEHKSWEECLLRKWLNETFLNTAFSEEEQKMIPTVTLPNPGNKYCRIKEGADTEDKVFALSVEEALKYYHFSSTDKKSSYFISEELIAEPTPYAISQGTGEVTIDEARYEAFKNLGLTRNSIGKKMTKWWLRTPAISSSACMVGIPGMVGESCYVNYSLGNHPDGCNGVRPAIYVYAKVSDELRNNTQNDQTVNEVQTQYRVVDTKTDGKAEMHYEYNERGQLVKLTNYDRSGITDYEYDENGRLIKETLTGMKTGNVKKITLYEYDEYGKLIKMSECKASGVVEQYTEYSYGEYGILSETPHHLDEKVWINYLYTYENGRLIKKSLFKHPVDKPSYEDEYWSYEYDADGNMVKEACYYTNALNDGVENFSYSYVYEYDDFGSLKKSFICYHEDGSKAILEHEYFYDQYDNLTRTIYYMRSGDVSYVRTYAYEEVPISQ